jgi:hypothetical protein
MKVLIGLGAAAVILASWLDGLDGKYFGRKAEVCLVEYAPGGAGPAPVGDGVVRGRVFVAKTGGSTARPAKGLYGKTASRLSSGSSVDKRALVFVLFAPGKHPLPQSRPAMRQKNVTIVPRVLPVLVGTTVDFPNEDEIYHNIFSLSAVKSFDLGRYAKGVSKSVKFDRYGEVRVFCDIHSQMSGFVWVLQNPYFATTESDGSYRIASLPAGTYDLVAWHENGGRKQQKITVQGAQETVVDFNF